MSIDMVWGAVKRFFGSPNKITGFPPKFKICLFPKFNSFLSNNHEVISKYIILSLIELRLYYTINVKSLGFLIECPFWAWHLIFVSNFSLGYRHFCFQNMLVSVIKCNMGSNFLICSKVEGYLYLFSHKYDSLRKHSSVENAFDLDAKVSKIDSW